MTIPEKNTWWTYHGQGLDSFGVNGLPVEVDMPQPGPHEVLARVDAFTLCASDVKMIVMGNDYPLFKGRDFNQFPAVTGHELSLTVVKPGSEMKQDWPPGKRFGVQPDVYLNGERFCIGVNVNGGMAEYILLGKEVFFSDQGSCAFPVADDISYAAVAQTEPLACVEAAFVQHSRTQMKPDGQTLIYVSPEIKQRFVLDMEMRTPHITVVDPGRRFADSISGLLLEQAEKILRDIPDTLFDDIIVLGNPVSEIMTQLSEKMAVNAVFCWLTSGDPQRDIDMDVAKVHYNKVNLIGSSSGRLSTAFNKDKYRYDYKPGGTLIISGGGGTMGRIHLLRALKSKQSPQKIIITNNSRGRLDAMEADFREIVAAAKKDVFYISLIETPDHNAKIHALIGDVGASDIIICAPGVEPLNAVVDFLCDDGTIVLFSGTRYGQFGKVPFGLVAGAQASITASSGSSVADQLRVLEKIESGEIDPDFNVAAIGGLMSTKAGLEGVKAGTYTGKVVIYPQLKHLPLMPLHELKKWDAELGEFIERSAWSLQAEQLLSDKYHEKYSDKNSELGLTP